MRSATRRRRTARAAKLGSPKRPRPSATASSQHTSSFADIPPFVITGGTRTLDEVWGMLQRLTARSPSTPATLVFALTATIANHLRRTEFYDEPLVGFIALRTDFADDWRLVLSRPDMYVEAILKEANWTSLVYTMVAKNVWDNAAIFGAEVCFPDNGQPPPDEADESFQFAAAVFYIVWLLAAIETAVEQSSCIIALAWSLASLVRNNPALLMRIAAQNKLGVALLAYPTTYFFGTGIVPTVVGAVRNSLHRKPGALLVILGIVGSLHTLLVHRSRLYIAIEASGFIVFMTMLGVSTALLLAAQNSRTRQKRKGRPKKK